MGVVIDHFEIIRDEPQPEARGAQAGQSQRPPSGPPPLTPRDIEDTVAHLARRALRVRAS